MFYWELKCGEICVCVGVLNYGDRIIVPRNEEENHVLSKRASWIGRDRGVV
jgi:hypothetical protein